MILGLNGLPGSGKDTIAERAAQFSSLPVEQRSFADKLKQSAAALLGISIEEMEALKRMEEWEAIDLWFPENGDPVNGFDQKLIGMTMRKFLQRYGTEAHREIFGEEFWLDQCLPMPSQFIAGCDIHLTPYASKLYIITDVRFPNEAERVMALGGKMVEVIGVTKDGSAHASDQRLGPQYVNYGIHNQARNDNFKQLDGQIEVLLAHLGVRKVTTDEKATAIGSRD